MQGFFEVENTERKKTRAVQKVDCYSCGLYRQCNTPKMDYYGEGQKKILIIDSFPNKREDDLGKQGLGNYTKFLEETLEEMGYNMKKDCWMVNALRCHPQNIKKLKHKHLNACRKYLLKTVEELKPEKIITLGFHGLYGLVGDRMSTRISMTEKNMERWVGWKIPDQKLETMIFPNYPLWEVYKSNDEGIMVKFFKKYLQEALDSRGFKKYDYDKVTVVAKTPEDGITYLRLLAKEPMTAFDYETTSIKPQVKARKILCIGISNGKQTYGIPIFRRNKEFMEALKEYLTSPNKKIGHNMQFEETWTNVKLGYKVNGWYYDSMIGTHVLDNRAGISGLKFQSYALFGIVGYDDAVDPYMTARDPKDKKNKNAENMLEDMDISEVCSYCGSDAHLTFHIGVRQLKTLNNDKHLMKGYQLLHEGALTMVDITANGIAVNEEALIKNELILEKKMMGVVKQINDSEEVKKWNSIKSYAFNFNSPPHLGQMFYDLLGYEVVKWTTPDTGEPKPSTDKEALENLNSSLAVLILEYKRYYKIKNTYLAGIKRETVNGFVHPGFSLHLALSYRSSSQNPNAQNYPKHDSFAMEMIRSCLGAHPGQFLVEADYSGAETRVSVDYNKDSNLLKYLMDKSTDMHRDIGSDLFKKPAKEITKDERFIAKSGITFAFFYGMSGANAAVRIWNMLLTPAMKKDLKKRGIKNFDQFVKHLEKLHDIFWKKRFPYYAKWKDAMWEFYKKNGFIRFKTGFRSVVRMGYNDCSNWQVQGSAFHCLLYSIIKVNKYLKEGNFKSKVIFQIHDSIGLSICKDEWETIKPVIDRIMTEDLMKEWRWIRVPMRCDFDFCTRWWNEEDTEENIMRKYYELEENKNGL